MLKPSYHLHLEAGFQLDDFLKIRYLLNAFMEKHSQEITGKLTYEATAFWSLHGVRLETLPQIVDQVKVLQ